VQPRRPFPVLLALALAAIALLTTVPASATAKVTARAAQSDLDVPGDRLFPVGSPAMEDALLGLGADAFVSYEDGDRFVDVARDLTGGLGADVVLDTVGGDTLERSVPALAEHGRMATIVGDAAGAFGKAYQKNGTVHLVFMERDGGMLDRIARLAERGLLRPLVADVLPLAEAAEAHRRLEAGGVHGKLVLTP